MKGYVFMTIEGKYIYAVSSEPFANAYTKYEEVANVNHATIFINDNPASYKLTNIAAVIPATEERKVTLIPI